MPRQAGLGSAISVAGCGCFRAGLVEVAAIA